jgi:hypothetical protein
MSLSIKKKKNIILQGVKVGTWKIQTKMIIFIVFVSSATILLVLF